MEQGWTQIGSRMGSVTEKKEFPVIQALVGVVGVVFCLWTSLKHSAGRGRFSRSQ